MNVTWRFVSVMTLIAFHAKQQHTGISVTLEQVFCFLILWTAHLLLEDNQMVASYKFAITAEYSLLFRGFSIA